MPCMFCGSEENLTNEHVFPAFTGGELKVPNGSCKGCNAGFGKLEASLKNDTRLLLNLLQIENRYGEVPKAKVNIAIQGDNVEGLFGFRDGSGELNLQDIVVDRGVQEDGKKRLEGFFISKESAEKFIEGAHKRGEKVTELVPKDLVIGADYTVTLYFAFSLATRKVAAKIALAAIAHQYGVHCACSEHFSRLRQVLAVKDMKDLPIRIFANELFMSAHLRTAHQHSVMCYLSAGMRKGWAVVTLFGGLSYVVEITDNYTERESRQFSIFYDADSKEPINPVVLADEIALIGHILSPATIFEDWEALDRQWFPIILKYCEKTQYRGTTNRRQASMIRVPR